MAGQETLLNTDELGRTQPVTLADPNIKRRSLWLDAIRRFRRNRLAMVGLLVVLFLLFLAIFADLISPYPYDRAFLNIRHPVAPFANPDHLLGTDRVGRDYLSRLIYGARTSMFIGLLVPIITFSIGIPLGALAGYRGGRTDFIIQRIVEIGTAIPGLLFALMLLSIAGNGLGNVILVLSFTGWIGAARLARAQFLTLREREYVTAARALGATEREIIVRHIFPNAFSPLLIAFTFAVPGVIFAEAGLSFLGLGIVSPTASWGQMVNGNTGSNIQVFPHLALLPTLLVAMTMLGFSFAGDGLQEALDVTRSD